MVSSLVRDFSHLQKAVDAVEGRIQEAKEKNTDKVKASGGLIFTRTSSSGDKEILMGRLNKLNRPNPKDDAKVHGAYGAFSGSVELSDSGKGVPTICAATAREVKEESLGVLKKKKVLDLLSQPSTQLLENSGWKFFSAASFHVKVSPEEGDEIVNAFNQRVKDHPQHEITDLAWISLKELVQAQEAKEAKYNQLKSELEQARGSAFTPDELRTNPDLGEVYNKNVEIAPDVRVAHFVARTIVSNKKLLA